MGMPDVLRSWTREEVLALPDDGNRYELIEGELLVSPSPRYDRTIKRRFFQRRGVADYWSCGEGEPTSASVMEPTREPTRRRAGAAIRAHCGAPSHAPALARRTRAPRPYVLWFGQPVVVLRYGGVGDSCATQRVLRLTAVGAGTKRESSQTGQVAQAGPWGGH